jgi:hypothetical protein
MVSKIYTISYHEVQIAGYRTFIKYEDALKEFLKHCIMEVKSVLESPCSSSDEEEEEVVSDSDTNFDEMTCVFEVQELQDNEFVTVKEYDFEAFQMVLEDVDDVQEYLEGLEKSLEEGNIPTDLAEIFSE